MRSAWSALFAMLLVGTVWGQEDAELERLKKAAAEEKKAEVESLPDRVNKLEKAMQDQQKKTAWDPSKMLSFSTPDGEFTGKLGGRIYFTYLHAFDHDDSSGAAEDRFALDTARLQLDGTFYQDFFYRVETEAQSQSDSGRHRMKDTYLGWNIIPGTLAVQGGQMKLPWSQEETCSSRFIDFGERSILNRLAPGHDTGVMFKGTHFDKVFEWNLGVFNAAFSRDAGRNTVDANDEKELALRFFVSPLKDAGPYLKSIRLGLDHARVDIDGNVAHPDITTGDLGGITFADFNATTNVDGMRSMTTFNVHWNYGPASLRGEYAVINQELRDGTPEGDFDITAWYIQGTYLLTGEAKPLENRIKPIANLNPAKGDWGAFELAARIAEVDVDDAAVDGLIMAATANQTTREIAFGVNWWWTPNIALRLNFERFKFDEELAAIATGGKAEDTQDVFYARWQVDF